MLEYYFKITKSVSGEIGVKIKMRLIYLRIIKTLVSKKNNRTTVYFDYSSDNM